ncbi:MAG: multidrug ABC transporter ATP-binding protein [Chlamydiales bacterium 38-26]|nr:ATP-binding cassette domain-containing protein [Chlamydiales bacterium]OJV09291.1 MAG: multidrug ABC transporter ATP-binding protein [Chlamydiales bacterium 38-26]
MSKLSVDKAIKVRELSHYYNSHPAVDHISFDVEKGLVFGLLGPNGAGKSTTIKMLTTLLPPTSGQVEIMGHDIVKESSKIREVIGYVPQLLSADGELTGYENLLLSTKLYGVPRVERDEKINQILLFMGLQDYADILVNQYSGGMIRRLEIAQALVHNPSVLFLDEPTVGLDPAARKMLWKVIQAWKQEFGITILLTTHDMDEADRLCDRVAFMYQGTLVALDSPYNLKKQIGENASLDDVFVELTGTSIKESGDYRNVKQIRRTISNLD